MADNKEGNGNKLTKFKDILLQNHLTYFNALIKLHCIKHLWLTGLSQFVHLKSNAVFKGDMITK